MAAQLHPAFDFLPQQAQGIQEDLLAGILGAHQHAGETIEGCMRQLSQRFQCRFRVGIHVEFANADLQGLADHPVRQRCQPLFQGAAQRPVQRVTGFHLDHQVGNILVNLLLPAALHLGTVEFRADRDQEQEQRGDDFIGYSQRKTYAHCNPERAACYRQGKQVSGGQYIFLRRRQVLPIELQIHNLADHPGP